MAYTGNVALIKRNKLFHCGIKTTCDKEVMTISICNKVWDIKDTVREGKAEEVTCKRCMKILERADEKGNVKI